MHFFPNYRTIEIFSYVYTGGSLSPNSLLISSPDSLLISSKTGYLLGYAMTTLSTAVALFESDVSHLLPLC